METILPRAVEWVEAYALWVYLVCGLAFLICLRAIIVARSQKKNAIFKLEREMAMSRESRAFSAAALLLGVVLAVTGLKFGIAPSVEVLPATPTATATSFIFDDPPTREVPTETPTEVVATATRRVIIRVPTPRPPTSTPAPQVVCADPNVCITSPAAGAQVSGVVQVLGTANIPQFQFYKLEYGLGADPDTWHSTSDIHRQPVVNGVLDTWNATGFPAGAYKLRLTVVDITGNFAPPYEISVNVTP